jgi:hypothetical protein
LYIIIILHKTQVHFISAFCRTAAGQTIRHTLSCWNNICSKARVRLTSHWAGLTLAAAAAALCYCCPDVVAAQGLHFCKRSGFTLRPHLH